LSPFFFHARSCEKEGEPEVFHTYYNQQLQQQLREIYEELVAPQALAHNTKTKQGRKVTWLANLHFYVTCQVLLCACILWPDYVLI